MLFCGLGRGNLSQSHSVATGGVEESVDGTPRTPRITEEFSQDLGASGRLTTDSSCAESSVFPRGSACDTRSMRPRWFLTSLGRPRWESLALLDRVSPGPEDGGRRGTRDSGGAAPTSAPIDLSARSGDHRRPYGVFRMAVHDPLGIIGELVEEKYRIERLVGEGGFAVVYRAQHVIWEKPVAVKFFNGLSRAPVEYRESLQQQFVQEGALLTELSVQTPGIVQARDIGFYTTPDGQWVPYMVLEWLEGSTLEAILEQDQLQGLPWSESEVVGFLRRVLAPLEVAHRSGVAHRDIKPANIFILGSAARSPDTPCKLLDFGVAKMVSDQSTLSAALARTGLAVTSFTPQYGAPEQFARSYGATGPWTDVYAVALVASEMFAGRAALEGEDLVQLGFASGNPDKRPTPRSLGARISPQLEAVFSRALAVHPQDRFANAGDFLRSTLVAVGQVAKPEASDSVAPPFQAVERLSAPSGAPSALPAPRVSEGPATQGAAVSTLQPSPASSSEDNIFGILLVMLVALGAGTAVYSATSLPGAEETRRIITAMARDVRQLAAGFTSKGASGASPSAPLAASMPTASTTAVQLPAQCPPGSWRLSLSSTNALPAASAGPVLDAGAPARVCCIDEREVSERDYAACSACGKPPTVSPKARTKGRGAPKFCASGTDPTDEPIRCVTWKQADAFCRSRRARLPTHLELEAAGQATIPKGAKSAAEWTSERSPRDLANLREFRCVTCE